MYYRSYSGYLKEKYGGAAYRVGVDAGFSCPNRQEGRPGEGCIFCDELGSRAVYLRNDDGSYPESGDPIPGGGEGFPPAWSPEAVESQVERAVSFLKRRYSAEHFLLYFQAFSGTDASPAALKHIYEYALSLYPFRELIVSTRPDCLNREKAALLGSFRTSGRDVWCELGLQTASDRLLREIRRGHTVAQFRDAFALLREAGVKIAVHLITGLPGERPEERDASIRLMQELKPEGIKIHNLNVPYNTELYRRWKENPFPVASMEEHIEELLYYLRRLPPEMIIMRMTCDTDRERLAVPQEKWNKSALIQKLEKRMAAEGAVQGDLL